MNKKVILVVRDGWGYKNDKEKGGKFFTILKNVFKKESGQRFNALELANLKNTEKLEKEYPTMYLNASGKYVGLPDGYMGNSEVGHMTMGAGRVILQSLERINQSIDSGEFLKKKEILGAIQHIKKNNSKLHLIILMQDAGVHSHINHLFETLKFCQKEGLKQEDVVLHLITDGRDDDPQSGVIFLAEVAEKMEKMRVGLVGTISGRYYTMDRNQKMDRTELAFEAIFRGKSLENFTCGMDKLYSFYQKEITDEFIPPVVKSGYEGVKKNDAIFFLNFRKDRARQLTHLLEEKINEFNLYLLTMTKYYNDFSGHVVFDDLRVDNTLGEILEKNKKTQLRISETEKYAHVTFFFDGGRKKDEEGKKTIVIPSPNVATYDLKPEMSSQELTDKVLEEIERERYDFVLLNYPNGDMVGHTGNLDATIKAVEAVDEEIGRLIERALDLNYSIILTADHGNAEEISKKFTSHTKNKVPFTLVDKEFKGEKDFLKKGEFGLANIAPTVLKLMGIEKPKEMDEPLF